MKINKKLDNIFYNINTGFTGYNQFLKKVKNEYPELSNDEINDYYKNQEINQIHNSKTKNKTNFLPIFSREKDSYQIDLTFLPNYKNQNRGYEIILCCIDINTRKVYAYKLKNKTSTSLLEVLEEFIKNAQPKTITSDNGSEFLNKKVEKLFNDNNIIHYTTTPGDKNTLGKIERFNRTLKQRLNKYMTSNNNVIWYNVLDEVINNYNNSFHRSIKTTPNELANNEKLEDNYIRSEEEKTRNILSDRNKQNINIGDYCRIRKKKNNFSKEGIYYSTEVYEIVDIDRNYNYKLKNLQTDTLKHNKVKYSDILIIPKNNYKNINKDEENKEVANNKLQKILKRDDIKQENIILEKRKRK